MSNNNINSENRLTAGAQTYKDIVTVITKDADWLHRAGLVIDEDRRRKTYNTEVAKEINTALCELDPFKDEKSNMAYDYYNLRYYIEKYLSHTYFSLANGLGVDILKNIIDTIDLGVRINKFKERVREENWTVKDANDGMKEFWIEYVKLSVECRDLQHSSDYKMILSFEGIVLDGNYFI